MSANDVKRYEATILETPFLAPQTVVLASTYDTAIARLTERVLELKAALEQIAACDTIETFDEVDVARAALAALAKRAGG